MRNIIRFDSHDNIRERRRNQIFAAQFRCNFTKGIQSQRTTIIVLDIKFSNIFLPILVVFVDVD